MKIYELFEEVGNIYVVQHRFYARVLDESALIYQVTADRFNHLIVNETSHVKLLSDDGNMVTFEMSEHGQRGVLSCTSDTFHSYTLPKAEADRNFLKNLTDSAEGDIVKEVIQQATQFYKWIDYRYDPNRSWLTFDDADGHEVAVFLKRVDILKEFFVQKNDEYDNDIYVYRLDFSRNGGDDITGNGKEVSKIFATVIEAARLMIQKLKELHKIEVDVLLIGAVKSPDSNRGRLYKRMIDRLSSRYGFEEKIDPDLKTRIDSHIRSGTGKPFDLFYLTRKK
jgi:hypothetical protein